MRHAIAHVRSIPVSYLDHTAAAQAKAHSYVYEALGLTRILRGMLPLMACR